MSSEDGTEAQQVHDQGPVFGLDLLVPAKHGPDIVHELPYNSDVVVPDADDLVDAPVAHARRVFHR